MAQQINIGDQKFDKKIKMNLVPKILTVVFQIPFLNFLSKFSYPNFEAHIKRYNYQVIKLTVQN
jgi:hypothetical protein